MMYVTAAYCIRRRGRTPNLQGPESSRARYDRRRARSASADFTSTWSKPAACALRSPAVSVWFVKPMIGTSGYESATSSGSTRAMSAITSSGTRAVGRHEVVAQSSPSSFPRRTGRPPEQDRRHGGSLERDGGCVQARTGGNSRRPLLRGSRSAQGCLARRARGRARLLPGARARRRRVVPGRARPGQSRPGGSSKRQRGGLRPSRRHTVESTSTACSLNSQRRRPASRQARSTSSGRG